MSFMSMEPISFSGEHAKDNAPGWIRTLCETGISGSKKHPKECRRARLDIDWRVRNAVAKWKSASAKWKLNTCEK